MVRGAGAPTGRGRGRGHSRGRGFGDDPVDDEALPSRQRAPPRLHAARLAAIRELDEKTARKFDAMETKIGELADIKKKIEELKALLEAQK